MQPLHHFVNSSLFLTAPIAVLAAAAQDVPRVDARPAEPGADEPAPRSHPNTPLREWFEGPFAAAVGDVNGDGFSDLAISNRDLHHDPEGRVNSVRVYASRTGDLVLSLAGGPGFGYHIASAGDVDADGRADLLVTTGDRGHRDESSTVQVFSGASGDVLFSVSGDGLGRELAALGDVDRDGHGDIAYTVGHPRGRPKCVEVVACSGATGSELWRISRASPDYYASYVGLEPIGDTNRDGIGDLAFVGPRSHGDGARGDALYVLSGLDGTQLIETGEGLDMNEGYTSLAATGDVDGDGAGDVIVGGRVPGSQVARIYSGGTGKLIQEFHEDARYYGWAVAGVGDFDGDGSADVAIAAPPFEYAHPRGTVFVYSAIDRRLIRTVQGAGDDEHPILAGRAFSFGICLAGVGDFDGDGYDDLLVGEERDFGFGSPRPDRVVLIAGAPRAPGGQR